MAENERCSSCGYRLDVGSGRYRATVVTCPACGQINDLPGPEGASGHSPALASQSFDERRAELKKQGSVLAKSLRLLAAAQPDLESLHHLVEAVRSELMVGHGPQGESLDLAELSARLAFAPRVLERFGHNALAAQLNRLREELEALALAAHQVVDPATSVRTQTEPLPPALRTTSAQLPQPRVDSRLRLIILSIGGLVLALIAGTFWWYHGHAPAASSNKLDQGSQGPRVTNIGQESASGQSTDSAGTPNPSVDDQTENFLDHVSAARTALLEGRLEEAAGELRSAATISTERELVFSLGDEIRDALVTKAGQDMVAERWQEADQTLALAISLSGELGRSLADAERLYRDLGRGSWHRRVDPRDAAAIAELLGREVVIEYGNGTRKAGVLTARTAQSLTLEVSDGVAGGQVAFDVYAPLSELEAVRFAVPADPQASRHALEEVARKRAMPELLAD